MNVQTSKTCPHCKCTIHAAARMCFCGYDFFPRPQYVPPAPAFAVPVAAPPPLTNPVDWQWRELARRYKSAKSTRDITFIVGIFALWPLWIVAYIEHNKMQAVKSEVAALGVDPEVWVKTIRARPQVAPMPAASVYYAPAAAAVGILATNPFTLPARPLDKKAIAALMFAVVIIVFCCWTGAAGIFAAIPNSSNLEVSNVHEQSGEYVNYIVGTVTNNSDRTYGYVQVEINLYNGENQVGSTLANVNNLEPHKQWDFKTTSMGQSYSSYKVKKVTGF